MLQDTSPCDKTKENKLTKKKHLELSIKVLKCGSHVIFLNKRK
jgi:hypothetical protein